MTRPRSSLVSLEDTPAYHCVTRCVRRAFLCGEDAVSGQSFEHRRGWIAERVMQLAGIFGVHVAAYAVMSNHYHVVLYVDRAQALGWSLEEVLHRWTQLFTGPALVIRYLGQERASLTPAEGRLVEELAEVYRARLHDISWFMRTLNEFIARKANAEDKVTGRFWEGRFKSQALLDEQALLAAMAYVDLNPVRAGLADTPEASDYTSVQQRVLALEAPQVPVESAISAPAAAVPAGDEAPGLRDESAVGALPHAGLMPFDATGRAPWAIPFSFPDYLELLDWTGRAIRCDKRGFIPADRPQILNRLNVDAEHFIRHAEHLLGAFGSAVGAPAALVKLCARRQTRYLRGLRMARRLFTAEAA